MFCVCCSLRVLPPLLPAGDQHALPHHLQFLSPPGDVTTNPSLIFKAAQRPEHDHLLRAALAAASRGAGSGDARFAAAADELSVAIGCEMLKLVPGRVSTVSVDVFVFV